MASYLLEGQASEARGFQTPREEEQRIASHPIAFESETPLGLSPSHYPSPDVPKNASYHDKVLRNARSATGAVALGRTTAGTLGSPENGYGYGKPSEGVVRASMPSASGSGHASPVCTGANGSSTAPLAARGAALTSASVDMLSKRMNLGGHLVSPTPTTTVAPTPAASVDPTPATSVYPTPAASVRPSPQTTPLKLPKWATGLSLSNRAANNVPESRAKRTITSAFDSTDDPSIVIPPQQADLRPTPLTYEGERHVLADLPQNHAEGVGTPATHSSTQAEALSSRTSKPTALKSPDPQDISDSSVLYSGSMPSGYASAYSSPEYRGKPARAATASATSKGVPRLYESDTPLVPTTTATTHASSPSTGERGVGYWAQRADYWHTRAKMHTETSQQFLPGSLAGLLAMPRVEADSDVARAHAAASSARKQLSQSLDTEALRSAALHTTPLKAGEGPVLLRQQRATPPTSPPRQERHLPLSSMHRSQGLSREDMPLKALPAPQPSPEPLITPPRSKSGLDDPEQSRASVEGTPLSSRTEGHDAINGSSDDLSAVVSSVAKIKESLRSSQEPGGTLSPDYCNALESELGKLQECLESFRRSANQQVGGDTHASTSPAAPAPPAPHSPSHNESPLPPAAPTPEPVLPSPSKPSKPPKPNSVPSPAKPVGCFACMFPAKNKYQQK